ncbi:MAG: hypothetical protein LW823_06760 [Rickettsiales bacterium]|jgi:hypothetical protein|nr:hypothetical protein [Rickettsiales bacterium]
MSTKTEMVVENTAPTNIDVRAVITVTARLAQLLAEEVDLLTDMKVSKIEHLQHEKIFLTNALEAQKRLIEKHPYMLDSIPSQDKHDLEQVVEVFSGILEENHRKLLLAKEVNHKIVEAITSVVKENTQSKVYDDRGVKTQAQYESLSVTLNQTI